MSGDAVTQRWTEAFFRLAQRRGALVDVGRDLERLAHEVASPAVRQALFNPRLDHAARARAVDALCRGLNPLTQNLVRLAFDKRREAVLLGLPAAFARRSLAEGGSVEGVVESARPIDAAELAAIAAALEPRLGKKLVLENRIRPELVGGVRVLADNRMIDGSVQGRLEGLGRRMRAARLPSPQTRTNSEKS